jgi:aminoglycoside phosphotransferase (APT) family kinase protein
MRAETLRPFGSGHSGFTYAIDTEGGTLVLRLSPAGVRVAGPADVGRQGRIMTALHAQGFPVPRVLACSSEPSLDGRSFALMELTPGLTCDEAIAAYGGAAVCEASIAVSHALAKVPLARTSLAGEAPSLPTDEIDRWAALLAKGPADARGAADALTARLRETAGSIPPFEPALVHGDFHYANLLFDEGQVVAVLDWELAGLGTPLVDLASLTVTALRSRYRPDPNPSGDVGLSAAEVAAAYHGVAEHIDWATALGCLKYAGIIAYGLHLHRTGRRHDPVYENLVLTMHGLLTDGAAILDDGLDAVPSPSEEIAA